MNTFFIKALNKLQLLSYLNVNGSVQLNNKRFIIPLTQGIGFSNLFMSEPWMVKLLQIILPLNSKKFVDVGVNVGQTLLKVRSVSPDIEYIGFEPNPMCVNYVSTLLKENDLGDITLIPVGVSDQSEIGVLNFFYESTTDSSASMIENFRPDQKVDRQEFIPLFNLEKINEAANLKDISVLKIDVEGAELEVLNSFKEIIQSQQPIIMIEILPAYKEENTFRVERQNKIQEILKETGYSIYRVIKQNEQLLDVKLINEIGIHSELNDCEYVMVPKNKCAAFEDSKKRVLK